MDASSESLSKFIDLKRNASDGASATARSPRTSCTLLVCKAPVGRGGLAVVQNTLRGVGKANTSCAVSMNGKDLKALELSGLSSSCKRSVATDVSLGMVHDNTACCANMRLQITN